MRVEGVTEHLLVNTVDVILNVVCRAIDLDRIVKCHG